jgi:hypothetical protein
MARKLKLSIKEILEALANQGCTPEKYGYLEVGRRVRAYLAAERRW